MSEERKINRLGKRRASVDRRTLMLHNYLQKGLPVPPEAVAYTSKIGADWGMMLNDQLGCCTIAAPGHAVEQWTAYASQKVLIPDSAILRAYEAKQTGGYVPDQPSTDNGASMLDVLNYFRKTGIGGYKIDMYAALRVPRVAEVKLAVTWFGNANIGVQLPLSVQGEDVWNVGLGGPSGSPQNIPGSWGGHDVLVVGYDPEFLTFVSWGALMKMTWNFYLTYCDEAYVMSSRLWVENSGFTPSGINVSKMNADAQLVASV